MTHCTVALDFNLAAQFFHDAPDDGQTQAMPSGAIMAEPCEWREQAGLILRRDAATIVAYPEADLTIGLGGRSQSNVRWLAAIFDPGF